MLARKHEQLYDPYIFIMIVISTFHREKLWYTVFLVTGLMNQLYTYVFRTLYLTNIVAAGYNPLLYINTFRISRRPAGIRKLKSQIIDVVSR